MGSPTIPGERCGPRLGAARRPTVPECRHPPPPRGHARLALVIVLGLGAPTDAQASKATFVEAMRQVATTVAAADCGTVDWAAAADHLRQALAAWDAELERVMADAAADLKGSSPERAVDARRTLGLAYAERGKFTEALREVDAALIAAPARADLHLLRALTLDAAADDAADADRAASAYRQAWDLDEQDPVKAYYALTRAGLAPDARGRAHGVMLDTYRRLLTVSAPPDLPPFPTISVVSDTLVPALAVGDAVSGPAFDLLARGKFDEGIAMLTRAAAAPRPGTDACGPGGHAIRGRLHETASQLPEARLEYAAALAGTLIGRTTFHTAIARLAQAEGDFERAVESFAQAARRSPNAAHVHKEFSTAYAAQNRIDDAFAELVAAVLIAPGDAEAHAAVGQLFVDAERYADAIPALTRALELEPDRFERRYALGMALTGVGKSAEAAHQLELFEAARRQSFERRRDAIAPVDTPAQGTRDGDGR